MGARRSPLPWMAGVVLLIGGAGAYGVVHAAHARTGSIERIGQLVTPGGEAMLDDDGKPVNLNDPVDYGVTNYLLVGSDSREGLDEAFIGTEGEVGGRRSDTIMVLHIEANGGTALVSVPRDLWVPIAGKGKSNRVNAAFNDGPITLVNTVAQALDIPIHHYVEVDFPGFRNIIDSIGGVELCVEQPVKDDGSGLNLQPGCQVLDGNMALAYARSRHYKVWNGERWSEDPRADLGRIERQQLFLRAAVNGSLAKLESDPFGAGETVQAVVESVRIDDDLDPLKAAQVLRQAFGAGLRTFALPVYNDTVGDAAILRMRDSAGPLLDYLRGEGPAPDEFDTSASTGG